ncbi:MAG: tRNA (adenosine(37)-N6)-threonylcarbamoyltransferase complex dimerization subunit type 1 TsaB [Candidatus Latescibacterota bacterium]
MGTVWRPDSEQDFSSFEASGSALNSHQMHRSRHSMRLAGENKTHRFTENAAHFLLLDYSGENTMLVLGIETATWLGSVALVTESVVIAEYSLNIRRTHSERLMGMIARLLSDADVALEDLDGIAVSIGPGSFTGLRIGLSTAKGLCFANDLPLLAVPTLEAMASRLCFARLEVCPLLDARGQEVYTARYDVSDGGMCATLAPCAIPIDNLLEHISRPTIFSGDGTTIFRAYILDKLGDRAFFAPSDMAHPNAAAVARLGLSSIGQGGCAPIVELEPIYLRRSEAEAKGTARTSRSDAQQAAIAPVTAQEEDPCGKS